MESVTKGFFWSFFERFATQGVSFVLGILIARMVSPESYGLIVMIQVFISLSQIFVDGGFSNALIQKQNRKEIDFTTVFYFNLCISTIFYVIIYVLAPFISSFYNEKRLIFLIRILGLNLIISSFSIVQRTKCTINLDFKTQTKVAMSAVLLSGTVGLVLAFFKFEVWALVAQNLVSCVVTTIVFFYLSRWKPLLCFSFQSFKTLFGFGSKLMISNLLTSIYLNMYNLIIGKFYSSSQLAFYDRAFTITQYPSTNIIMVLNRIIYPITCRYQNDVVGLKNTYIKYLHLSNYIIMPLMLIVAILARPFIIVVLTEKWVPAYIYVSIFGATFFVHAWLSQIDTLINAVGKSALTLKLAIVVRVLSFIVLICVLNKGIKIICLSVAVVTYFQLILSLLVVEKVMNITIVEQLKSQLRLFFALFITGCALYFFTLIFTNNFILLFGGSGFAFSLYILLTFLLKLDERYFFVGLYGYAKTKFFTAHY